MSDIRFSTDPVERLVRLEEKHDNLFSLTSKIADNADTTAKALQELVVIHRETQLKADSDRKTVATLEAWINRVEQKHDALNKVVWRYIYIGTGTCGVLSLLWYAGMLPLIMAVGATP